MPVRAKKKTTKNNLAGKVSAAKKSLIQSRVKTKTPKGKKLISGGNSFTFKKVGDSISGKFVSLTRTASKKFKNSENVSIALETKDGLINVFSSHHLTQTIDGNVKKGQELEITLVEVKKLDAKRTYKLYDVYA